MSTLSKRHSTDEKNDEEDGAEVPAIELSDLPNAAEKESPDKTTALNNPSGLLLPNNNNAAGNLKAGASNNIQGSFDPLVMTESSGSEASPSALPGNMSFITVDAYQGSTLCCRHQPPDYICCVTSDWWTDRAMGYRWVKPAAIRKSYFISDKLVLCVRAVLAAWCLAVLTASIVNDFNDGYFFFYFTNLSYVGLTFYMCTVTGFSVHHLLYRHTVSGNLKRPANWFEVFTSWMYTSLFSIHMLVPLVYWTLLGTNWLWSEHTELTRWLNISRHGLDLFVIVVEFFLNRIVYVWGHLVVTCLLVLIYVFWSWIGFAIYGYFPYFFVDYRKASSFLLIAGIAVGFTLIWLLAYYMHYLKAYVGKRARRHRHIVSQQAERDHNV